MKISRFLIPFVFISLCGYFYSLPWSHPIEAWPKSQHGSVILTLLRSNNELISRTFDLSKTQLPIRLAGVRIQFVEFTSANSLQVFAGGNSYFFDETHQPELPSSRNKREILLSIVIVSLVLTYLVNALYVFFSTIQRNEQVFVSIIYGLHFGIFSTWLYQALPGYFTYDSFQYLADGNIYYLSDFSSLLFSAIMMVSYQLVPFEWILSLGNIFIIATCLTYLFYICYKRNLLKYYFVACAGFYLWPGSIPFNLFSMRDISSHWILAFTLIYMAVYFLDRRDDRISTVNLVFLLTMTSLFRQESVYILPLALLALSYRYQKKHLRFFAFVSLTLFTLSFLTTTYNHRLERSKNALRYKSTILINQLSYILRHLYGTKLPDEVNMRLGSYFKNQYLLDYPSDFEILPFHKGGVNDDFNPEDYDQFSSAAFEIFKQNPGLFLENRFRMAKMMLGLDEDAGPVLFNVYNKKGRFYLETKNLLSLRAYENQSLLIENLVTYFNSNYHLLFRSYLIPLILLTLLGLLSRKCPIFLVVLTAIALRTLLVFLTGPAGLFKYNYVLWILGFFGVPILVLERRSNIDNKQVSV